MKTVRYTVQYLTVVSLLLMLGSGIYDIWTGVRAAEQYLQWRSGTYGVTASLMVSTYAILLSRGVAVTFGCGIAGLAAVGRKRFWIWYLLFLGFWTLQYILAAFDTAYKGIAVDDVVQMSIAAFSFLMALLCAGMYRRSAAGGVR